MGNSIAVWQEPVLSLQFKELANVATGFSLERFPVHCMLNIIPILLFWIVIYVCVCIVERWSSHALHYWCAPFWWNSKTESPVHKQDVDRLIGKEDRSCKLSSTVREHHAMQLSFVYLKCAEVSRRCMPCQCDCVIIIVLVGFGVDVIVFVSVDIWHVLHWHLAHVCFMLVQYVCWPVLAGCDGLNMTLFVAMYP